MRIIVRDNPVSGGICQPLKSPNGSPLNGLLPSKWVFIWDDLEAKLSNRVADLFL